MSVKLCRLGLIAAIVATPVAALAQGTGAPPTDLHRYPLPIYEEDWRALQGVDRTDVWDPVKFVPLSDTCSAMHRFSRPAPISTRPSAVCTNRCGTSINPAPLASRLQADPPAATGLFASRLPVRLLRSGEPKLPPRPSPGTGTRTGRWPGRIEWLRADESPLDGHDDASTRSNVALSTPLSRTATNTATDVVGALPLIRHADA
jgi:hypothetical protein